MGLMFASNFQRVEGNQATCPKCYRGRHGQHLEEDSQKAEKERTGGTSEGYSRRSHRCKRLEEFRVEEI